MKISGTAVVKTAEKANKRPTKHSGRSCNAKKKKKKAKNGKKKKAKCYGWINGRTDKPT